MSDVNDALAGADERTSASILDDFEPDENEGQAPAEAERNKASDDDGADVGEDDLLLEDEDEAGDERNDKATKSKDEDFDTLRDGTKVSKKDLKEAYENRRNYERDRAAFEAKQQAFDQQAQRLTQSEQLFQAVIQDRMRNLPPEPDPNLARTDPGAFIYQQEMRKREIQKLQEAVYGYQQVESEQIEKRKADFDRHVDEERERLFERAPDLRDDSKREAFHQEMIAGARHYGFSNEEINSASDHRLMLMIRDANAYRKAVANRAKAAEKAKEAAPVVAPQSPGRRVSGAERAQAAVREQVSRLRKTGSAKDAEAFLSNFE